MARSNLNIVSDDLVSDSGSVLWSFVQGEQLEFPVTLSFIPDVTTGYTFEACVIEAANVVDQTDVPSSIHASPVTQTVAVRVPVHRGTWNPATAYNREDIAVNNGIAYRLTSGYSRVNSTPPNQDSAWAIADTSVVYLQFLKSIGSNWHLAPSVNYSVYGFFELRVTEPTDSIFIRTWKPVRGLVEIKYSPTYSVGD